MGASQFTRQLARSTGQGTQRLTNVIANQLTIARIAAHSVNAERRTLAALGRTQMTATQNLGARSWARALIHQRRRSIRRWLEEESTRTTGWMFAIEWRRVGKVDDDFTQSWIARIGAFSRARMFAGQQLFTLETVASGCHWASAEHLDRVPTLESLWYSPFASAGQMATSIAVN